MSTLFESTRSTSGDFSINMAGSTESPDGGSTVVGGSDTNSFNGPVPNHENTAPISNTISLGNLTDMGMMLPSQTKRYERNFIP